MKVAKPSSYHNIRTPPPPQRWRLDTNGSFEPIGVSEILGELALRANLFYFNTVEIEDLQDDEFARNFNTSSTDLNDPVIVQVRPFDPPMIGVPVGRIMSNAGEISFISTLATPIEAVLLTPISFLDQACLLCP